MAGPRALSRDLGRMAASPRRKDKGGKMAVPRLAAVLFLWWPPWAVNWVENIRGPYVWRPGLQSMGPWGSDKGRKWEGKAQKCCEFYQSPSLGPWGSRG